MNPLHYTIIRRKRRRTASIIIKPDGTVEVVVPSFLSPGDISAIIHKKKKWITHKLAEMELNTEVAHAQRYEEGEQFLFMGKSYQLNLRQRVHDPFLCEATLQLLFPQVEEEENSSAIRDEVLRWYAARALQILTEKTEKAARHYDLGLPLVGIKEYTSRWGCCFGDGRIYYNWKIILAPEEIIDYVVIHEVCHLAVPNHSKAYWRNVENTVPDWKEKRKWLRRNGHTLTF